MAPSLATDLGRILRLRRAWWGVYKIAAKAVWLGNVDAADEAATIEKGAAEIKVAANRLMAIGDDTQQGRGYPAATHLFSRVHVMRPSVPRHCIDPNY